MPKQSGWYQSISFWDLVQAKRKIPTSIINPGMNFNFYLSKRNCFLQQKHIYDVKYLNGFHSGNVLVHINKPLKAKASFPLRGSYKQALRLLHESFINYNFVSYKTRRVKLQNCKHEMLRYDAFFPVTCCIRFVQNWIVAMLIQCLLIRRLDFGWHIIMHFSKRQKAHRFFLIE